MRMLSTLGMTSLIVIGGMTGCDSRAAKINLERTVQGLEQRVAALESERQDLGSRVAKVENGVESLGSKYREVFLDPASPKGYARIDTSAGSFLVSLQDVQPYLDGFKLILHIGNTSAATYNGFKVKVNWGPSYDQAQSLNKDISVKAWLASFNEKEVSLTDEPRPAAWNRVELHIAPAKADQLGYLRVSMDTDVISLRKPGSR
jgi:hypothetical protein